MHILPSLFGSNACRLQRGSPQLRQPRRVRATPSAQRLGGWACLILTCPLAWEACALPVARMRNVRAPVEVRAQGAPRFTRVQERAPLAFGDTVRTGAKGKADILFANGTQVALKENSQIEIVAPETARRPMIIRVFGALSEVFVRPSGNTEVRTAAGILAARGTEYLLQLPLADSAVVTVVEGVVEFSNPQGSVMVAADQQSTARVGEAPTPPIAVDASGLIAWTAEITGLPVEFETPFSALDPVALQSARSQREAAVQAEPGNAAAHQSLGEVYYDLGQYDAAGTEFETAVRLAPENAAAYTGLGHARRGQGDLWGALSAYQRGLQIAPNDLRLRTGLALAYLAQGNREQARQALGGLEGDATARAVLGLLELREGNTALATEHLQAAVAQDSQLYQAHALLALAHLNLNQATQAEDAARRAVDVEPRSAQAQGTLAMVLFFAGRGKQATRAAQRAVKQNPLSPFALLTQGRILLSQLQTDEARRAFQQARALAPDLPIIHSELGAVYLRLDIPARAEQSYRRALELNPGLAAAHTGLGLALQRQGRRTEALDEHQQALRLKPDDSTARANLATLYIEEGRLEEARAELERGIADQPQRGLLYARLSEVNLLQRQDYRAAREDAQRAVELLPRSAVAHYQLGRAYLEQGMIIQAEEEFRLTTALDRHFAEARFALGSTRALVETRKFAPTPGSADLGSLARLISVANLQAPGVEDRIQAAVQDPTVIRVASRSYGDTQLDGEAGERGVRSLQVSHLDQRGDRRGEIGVIGEHDRTNGPRTNADEENNRFGIVLGQKVAGGPAGVFFSAQIAGQRRGLNGEDVGGFQPSITQVVNGVPQEVPLGLVARQRSSTPSLQLGYNHQSGERERTRFLLQYSEPRLTFIHLQNDSQATQDLRNASFEVRHDVQLSVTSVVSLGLALGNSRFLQSLTLPPPPIPIPLPTHSVFDSSVSTFQAYLRDEVKVSDSLTLIGEVQFQRARGSLTADLRRVAAPRSGGQPPTGRLFYGLRDPGGESMGTATDRINRERWLPTFIADYRLGPRDNLRLRARSIIGTVGEFQLLAPTDPVFAVPAELPDLRLTGYGSAYDLEYDHTFGNASFLRAALFYRRLTGALDIVSNTQERTRIPGASVQYTGALGSNASFFLSADYNSGRAQSPGLTELQPMLHTPRWSAQAGLTYLNREGWFAQPSVAFRGSRRSVVEAGPLQLSSYALLNLRVGKRDGLRSTWFIEANNLLDRRYEVFFPNLTQAGLTLRAGVTRRF